MTKLKHGIFDESCASVISLCTVHGVQREPGQDVDLRRYVAVGKTGELRVGQVVILRN